MMAFSIELIGFLWIPHDFLLSFSNEIKIWILLLWEILIVIYWFYIRNMPWFWVNQAWVLLVSNISDSTTLNEIIDRVTKDLQEKLWDAARVKTLKSEYHYNLMLDLNSSISAKKEIPLQWELVVKNIRYIIIFESWVRNNGELVEIKNIKQIVFHRPTHESNTNLLRNDLMFALGTNIDIPLKNERDEIDSLIRELSPCIKYIASVVDFLWWKDYANCRNRLIDMKNNQELILMWRKRNTLSTKINLLVWKTYEEEINMIISGFHEVWEYPEDRLNELLTCNQEWTTYFASCALRLQKAVLYFLLEWDTQNARKNINKAKWIAWNDQAWRVSLIFLDIWDWYYDEALKNIKCLKLFPNDKTFWESIELFNTGVLKKFPDRYELIFWNALISKKIINNMEKFHKYKKEFLSIPNVNETLKDFITKN